MHEPQRQLPFPLVKLAELLVKARLDRVELRPIPRATRAMLATSAHSDAGYIVDGDRCTCPAGSFGRPCKHRALWISLHADEYAEAILAESVGLALHMERTPA